MTKNWAKTVIDGYILTKEDALELLGQEETNQLVQWASEVREMASGKNMSLCTIANAKSGRCSEDCTYCAQSAHYDTGVECYPLIDRERALTMAREMEEKGVHRFSLVTSGYSLSNEEFEQMIGIIGYLKEQTKLEICASLGFLTEERAVQLKEAGLDFYHHNLETSPRHFPKICTTHCIEDKLHTIKELQQVGIPVCSGGIFGLGENREDRIEFILLLRELGIKHIPVNILTPILGTPLADQQIIDPEEVIRTVAVWRLVHPYSEIRWAGGRNNLAHLHDVGLMAGVNGLMVSNYLTTKGCNLEEDITRLKKVGFEV